MSINIEKMMRALGCRNIPAIQSAVKMQPRMEAMVNQNLVSLEKWWVHTLAQSAEESALFSRLIENLNYTTASRIRTVWPSRFPTLNSAEPYVRQPQKLANFVYNGRMGNRTGSNDGWERRGHGIIMLTGTDNFRAASRALNIDFMSNPSLAAEFDNAWLVTAWFCTTKTYRTRNIQSWMADDNIEAVTFAINGGRTNIATRKKYTQRLQDFVNSQPGSVIATRKPVLRHGSRGADVRVLQQALWNVGYAGGVVDGDFGDNTRNAVIRYQRSKNLTPDGVVGPKTWDALIADLC